MYFVPKLFTVYAVYLRGLECHKSTRLLRTRCVSDAKLDQNSLLRATAMG